MARTLAFTVTVTEWDFLDEKRPELGRVETRKQRFEPGDELPAWAAKLVGDHVYGDTLKPAKAKPKAKPEPQPDPAANGGDGNDGGDPANGEGSGEEVAKPPANGSLEAWREYAASRGATDDDLDGKSRDDLRAEYGN